MKTQYALRALSLMSREYGRGPLPLTVIAEKEHIPGRFLLNILHELKAAGLINSRMGKNGGYFLSRSPHEIDLLSIVQTCEQSVGLLDCVREDKQGYCLFCKNIDNCKTRDVLMDIRDYTISRLRETTLYTIEPL